MIYMSNEEIINIVISVLGGGGLGGLLIEGSRRYFQNRISLKRIDSIKDKDITELISLYESTIEPQERIRPEELIRFVGRPRIDGLFDNLLIWKKGKNVIGFIKFIHCSPENWIFVAYLGADKKNMEVRQATSTFMIKDLIKFVDKKVGKYDLIFFESESNRRHFEVKDRQYYGLARLLRIPLNQKGLYIYELDMDYYQPDIPTDTDYDIMPRTPMSLYIVTHSPDETYIKKEQVLKILNLLYIKIYRRTYEGSEMHDLYKSTLLDYIKIYNEKLPNLVPLIK